MNDNRTRRQTPQDTTITHFWASLIKFLCTLKKKYCKRFAGRKQLGFASFDFSFVFCFLFLSIFYVTI